MAIIVDGEVSSRTLQIGSENRAARTEVRPWNMPSTDGMFRVAAKSGDLTGTGIVAGAPLFSCRYNGGLSGSSIMLLTHLRAVLNVTTVFTAGQELGLDAVRATAFTAVDSAGTGISIAASENMMDSEMPGMGLSSLRIAAATLLTAGTRTLDTNAFAISNQVGDRIVNAAAATPYLPSAPQAVLDFTPDQWEHPLVIRAAQGFLVRNVVAFGAGGHCTLVVEMSWMEVSDWP